MTQLALEGLGGSGWYKMGWSGFIFGRVGLEQGGGRWKPGVEQSHCSHPGRAPGLHASLGKRFLGARELGQAGLPLHPLPGPAHFAVWPQTSSWLSLDRESPCPILKGLELTGCG